MRSTYGTIHYTTEPVTIGKHEWRWVVYSSHNSKRYTAHQFRAIGSNYWKDYHDWPRYNFNDGCFAGLPKSLAKKWLDKYDEIKAALTHEETPNSPSY